jgi:hypothetical protein
LDFVHTNLRSVGGTSPAAARPADPAPLPPSISDLARFIFIFIFYDFFQKYART